MSRMKAVAAVVLAAALFYQSISAQVTVSGPELKRRVEQLIRESGAESVGVAFKDLQTGKELLINGDESFHAASTMKVPVMMEIFRESERGELSLDQPLPVKNSFRSIADGSTYSLSPADDSDQSLYKRVGESVTVRDLLHLMITVSSNLATNILIERVTPQRIMRLMHQFGAEQIQVRRGVEDNKAYALGLNNSTTAHDLMVLLEAIASGSAISKGASAQMLQVLLGQEFNEGIPAGVPAGVKVAHKTGSITGIYHDAAIVLPPVRKPYVLVVLTRGFRDENKAHALVAGISRFIFERTVERHSG